MQLLAGTIAALALPALAHAPSTPGGAWPTRPITVVVPFPAGGPTDVVARTVLQKMAEALGQPMVIDNKPGAGGNIGGAAVAKAVPDVHTLLVGAATLTTSVHLYKQLGYDPLKDLSPVAMLARAPVFIWVRDDYPARTLGEMVALVKAKPAAANDSSSAPATLAHLGSLLFFESVGAQPLHINYKGSAQAINDLLGGVFAIHFELAQPVVAHWKAGKVRPLAVLGGKRSPLLPEVHSTAELGFGNIDATPIILLLAPAGTPRAVVERLNAEAARALQASEVRAKLAGLHFDIA